jgi:hypothetical protein
MFEWLKRVLRLSKEDSSAGEEVTGLDRLRRACARQAVDNERHALGPHFRPLLKDGAAHGDANQALSNDTRPGKDNCSPTGSLSQKEPLKLDRECVRSSGKQSSHLLFQLESIDYY